MLPSHRVDHAVGVQLAGQSAILLAVSRSTETQVHRWLPLTVHLHNVEAGQIEGVRTVRPAGEIQRVAPGPLAGENIRGVDVTWCRDRFTAIAQSKIISELSMADGADLGVRLVS